MKAKDVKVTVQYTFSEIELINGCLAETVTYMIQSGAFPQTLTNKIIMNITSKEITE